jgi:hypothetical protein
MCFLSRRPTITIVMCGLCVLGVFILDLITPLGVPVWLLYGVPFLFLHEYTPRYHVRALAGACTILILVGYLLSSGTQPEPIMERIGATIIVWSLAIMLVRRKQRA